MTVHWATLDASLVSRPLPLLRAGEGLVTFAIKTVASCRRKKCGTNQIAPFVCVTKRHVDWFSFTWCTMGAYNTVVSVTRPETGARTSETQEGYSILVDRSVALLKGCQNKALWKFCTTRPDSQLPTQVAVDVCWKHYPQLSCYIRYCLIELNLHGDSAIDMLATVWGRGYTRCWQCTHTYTETDRQTHTHTHVHTKTDRQTHTHTHMHTQRQTNTYYDYHMPPHRWSWGIIM